MRAVDAKICIAPGGYGCPSGRPGDFVVGDTAFHVTVSPMPPVLDKCEANLRNGYRSMLACAGHCPQSGMDRAPGFPPEPWH